ncbi:PSP1 C-terminal conserved region-domain-containing protein [Circinella umbellata]|nr:PSP1 C-terminal conserved region-domain-containing protein [Circinella umbellata]
MAALLPSYILSDTGSESSLTSSPTTPVAESWLDKPTIDLDFIDLDDNIITKTPTSVTKNARTTAEKTATIETNSNKMPLLPSLLSSKATPLPLPHSPWSMTSSYPPSAFWSSTIWNNSIASPTSPTLQHQPRRQSMIHYENNNNNYRSGQRRQSDFMGDGPRRFSTTSSSPDKKIWRTDDFLSEQQTPPLSRVPLTCTNGTNNSITAQNELSPELLQHIDDYFSPTGTIGVTARSCPSPSPPLSSSFSTTRTINSTSTFPPTLITTNNNNLTSSSATIGGDDTLSMGKGIPLHQLAPTTKLFMVELTHGTKPEVFYINNIEEENEMVQMDDLVIVEADRGHDLGKIISSDMSMDDFSSDLVVRRLYRLATEAEIATLPSKTHDEAKALLVCQSKIKEKGLPMQVISAEYQWDRRKLTFHFIAEERVDFRELVRELFKLYKTRIWMCAAKHPY